MVWSWLRWVGVDAVGVHWYQLKQIQGEIIYAKIDQLDVGVHLVGTQVDAILDLGASAATLKRDAPTSRFWVMEMMISGAIMIGFFLKLIHMGSTPSVWTLGSSIHLSPDGVDPYGDIPDKLQQNPRGRFLRKQKVTLAQHIIFF